MTGERREPRGATTPGGLREAVSRAASSPDLRAHGAPQALEAIADVLELLAGPASPAADSLREMRAEIELLVGLGAIDLDRADRVKGALRRGTEAMRAFARGRRASWLDRWVDAAATAEAAIDPETPLGLQRAAVQDALRTLADAVLVAEQFGPAGRP